MVARPAPSPRSLSLVGCLSLWERASLSILRFIQPIKIKAPAVAGIRSKTISHGPYSIDKVKLTCRDMVDDDLHEAQRGSVLKGWVELRSSFEGLSRVSQYPKYRRRRSLAMETAFIGRCADQQLTQVPDDAGWEETLKKEKWQISKHVSFKFFRHLYTTSSRWSTVEWLTEEMS